MYLIIGMYVNLKEKLDVVGINITNLSELNHQNIQYINIQKMFF
jgi:hypothetical protein